MATTEQQEPIMAEATDGVYAAYPPALAAIADKAEARLLDALREHRVDYERDVALRELRRTALAILEAVADASAGYEVLAAEHLGTRLEKEAEVILDNTVGRQSAARQHATEQWRAALERRRRSERLQGTTR